VRVDSSISWIQRNKCERIGLFLWKVPRMEGAKNADHSIGNAILGTWEMQRPHSRLSGKMQGRSILHNLH
jgi:hypothetical protein